jgi:drug/metabolite transporter (DMT)-like permease
MIWLFLSMLSTAGLFLFFKYFQRHNVNTFPAIVVNYITAFSCGLLFILPTFHFHEVVARPFTLPMFMLGAVFISTFYLMALTAQRLGVSVSSVAAKMSLALPVVIFILIDDNDHWSALKIIGLALAMAGIWFSSMKGNVNLTGLGSLALPLLVFLGSGLIDFAIGYYSGVDHVKSPVDFYLLSALPFCMASTLGVIALVYQKIRGTLILGRKELIGGFLLGVVNFGALYFLVKTVSSGLFTKSVIFPVNNLGVILVAAIASFFLFGERFSVRNKIGILLALLAIVSFMLA